VIRPFQPSDHRSVRPHAFNDSIVDSQFLAGFDVSRGEIDAVAGFCSINSDVRHVTVIHEAIVSATSSRESEPAAVRVPLDRGRGQIRA